MKVLSSVPFNTTASPGYTVTLYVEGDFGYKQLIASHEITKTTTFDVAHIIETDAADNAHMGISYGVGGIFCVKKK